MNLRLLPSLIKVVRDVSGKLLQQKWGALGSAPLVPNRILDFDFVQHGAVVEGDEQSIGDIPLRRLVVVDAILLVFNTSDLGTQLVNTWVCRRLISVRMRSELSEDKGVSDHVVDVMT